MKVVPYPITTPHDRSIVVTEDVLSYFFKSVHVHEEAQLTWILEGEGTLIVGSNIHAFRKNEIYFLGSNTPHLFKNEPIYFEPGSSKKAHAINIYFTPSGKLGHLFDLPELRSIRTLLHQFETGFKLPDYLFQEVSKHMLSIQHSEGIEQLTQFLQLLKSFGSVKNIKPLAGNSHSVTLDGDGVRIAAIYNYIAQNFDKQISLEEISDLANMTPHAFCRYFKKHTNYTFVNFLNKIRIDEACKMLINDCNNGISSIAYSCGFSSITNFNRVFKSVTSKSPSLYFEEYTNVTA